MIGHIAIEAARCYSCRHGYGGGGMGEYWIASWLWRQIGWWSILVSFTVFGGLAALKTWLGIDDA